MLSEKDIFKSSLDGTLLEKVDAAMLEAFKAGAEFGHKDGIYNTNYWDMNQKAAYYLWRIRSRRQVEK